MYLGNSYGQEKTSVSVLEFRYGYHLAAGDMADRFGSNSDLGVSFEMINLQNKLFAGADAMYLFGNNVKEDVVRGLRTFDGSILAINGSAADVNLKERGYYIGLNAGKIFPLKKEDKTATGIRAQIGAGFLQHKIRVQDNSESVVALERSKLKGFDRLTNGPAVHLALGFQYDSPKNNVHFHLMADVYGGRTMSRRDFDNATGGYLAGSRTDVLAGVTLAYIVTISRSRNPDQIYY